KKLLQSAVKQYAVAQDIPVLQPKNLKAPSFVTELRSYQADLQVVVAFRMLPEVVWNMPRLGTFNLHGSLLPKYRGAAPINWAVINGDTETGVSSFFLQHEIDTGDLLLQAKMPIGFHDTAGDVHDRMMELGAEVVLKTVRGIEADNLRPIPQDHTKATKAPKLFADNTHINFDQTSEQVHNFIRGLSPFPTAWARLNGAKWKLLSGTPQQLTHELAPGTIVIQARESFKVATADGFYSVKVLQMPGKRRMPVKDFLNGWRETDEVMRFE
ncbi:MAG: methionyl-tRNA formyltransferase, partial [Bacteroidota bacterium]